MEINQKKYRYKCGECGSTESFTAHSKTNINVVIDEMGEITKIPDQDLSETLEIQEVYMCNNCGTQGSIIILNAKEE